jgi:hypothetical protein
MQHDYKVNSQHLLNEWYYYKSAKPKGHIFDIQADKDDLQQWATLLQTFLLCSDNITTIAKICFIFENKLQKFKENIIIELLK